ncbi:hypothetical protein EB796_020549 [Bugula neritina]|uniref:Uncharacterized protein n=1 Tax=Bugula neritina TaxID=10212 RepID=A0A7J7J4P6_BUGNE|nr:hypothetical protein EB796_020549 [Bugula neritina]
MLPYKMLLSKMKLFFCTQWIILPVLVDYLESKCLVHLPCLLGPLFTADTMIAVQARIMATTIRTTRRYRAARVFEENPQVSLAISKSVCSRN